MLEEGFITVIKVKYVFKDGNEMSGLELNLAPKVKKFILINNDNAQLLDLMGNGLITWYNNANYGDNITLRCYTGKDKVVDPNTVAINFK